MSTINGLTKPKKLAESEGIKLIVEEYNPSEYSSAVKGIEDNKELRCPKCWKLRLERTANKAKELGIREFGTTLRISPYQNQEMLLELGNSLAEDCGLIFYQEELVKCFHESIDISKQQGMYRQKYCGCIYSKDYR